jgi:hypothetical protein
MIKSFIRKITRRELSDKLKDAATKLRAGDKTVKLPEGYHFYESDGKIHRTIHTDDGSIDYDYDENGLLESKWTSPNFFVNGPIQYRPHGKLTGKKEGARLSTLQRLGVTVGIIAAFGLPCYVRNHMPAKMEERSWQEFIANSPEYHVDINLSGYGDKYENITHLTGAKSPDLPLDVTGHDYDFDGKWDAVFIRRTEKNGYSHVSFRDGKVTFEPCPADKQDGIKRFTPEEIARAIVFLNQAQSYISEKNRIQNWNAVVKVD